MPAQFWYACWYSGIDDGKSGGAALVACALAGDTRNSGTQASAPAAAAPARKARRDGPAGRREGAADRGDPAGRRSWRGSIGSPSGRWGSAGQVILSAWPGTARTSARERHEQAIDLTKRLLGMDPEHT